MASRDPELLTVREAAALLRVHPWTIRRWAMQGRIRTTRFSPRTIRVARSELRRLLREAEAGEIPA